MDRELGFRLTGWSAWTVGRSTPEEWRAWAGSQGEAGYGQATVPANLRRRTTPVGQRLLAGALSLPEIKTARYVLSTRHGEMSRTVSLLTALRDQEALSPADFSMSVHHALIGLLSVATNNRLGHTAVSAGSESFCFGMLEAALCLQERPDDTVVLLHFDEELQSYFDDLLPEWERSPPIVVALALASVPRGQGQTMRMWLRPRDSGVPTADHAEAFLRFLLSGAVATVSIGDRMVWGWRRA